VRQTEKCQTGGEIVRQTEKLSDRRRNCQTDGEIVRRSNRQTGGEIVRQVRNSQIGG
jgi:hypothetical protein